MRRSKYSLISSVFSLIITCGLLISSIYAWYATNKNATVTGVSGSIIQSEDTGIEISNATGDVNTTLYPFKKVEYKLKATQKTTKVVISVLSDERTMDEFENYCNNNVQYVLGKYSYLTNNNFYNYEVSRFSTELPYKNHIDLLWNLLQNNNILNFLDIKLKINDQLLDVKKDIENNSFFIDGLNVLTDEELSFSLVFGIKDEFPKIKVNEDDYILSSNYNCFILGIKQIKLKFSSINENAIEG